MTVLRLGLDLKVVEESFQYEGLFVEAVGTRNVGQFVF